VAFYHAALGWAPKTMSDTPEFRLSAIEDGRQPVAGIMDASGDLAEGERPSWDIYVSVADTDKTLAFAAELGGGWSRREWTRHSASWARQSTRWARSSR